MKVCIIEKSMLDGFVIIYSWQRLETKLVASLTPLECGCEQWQFLNNNIWQ